MAEPTVQVPVSLIEQWERRMRNIAQMPNTADEMGEFLSQPTPTAEPSMGVIEQEVMMRAAAARRAPLAPALQPNPGWHLRRESEPPSIEDMAPGTRAAIERADLVLGGFVQHDWASSTSVHEWYLGELRKLRDALDPSTIRDVTPPKEGDRG